MKCTNCGFDVEGSAVCPICGTSNLLAQNNAPQAQPDSQGGLADFNPYAQSAQSLNQAVRQIQPDPNLSQTRPCPNPQQAQPCSTPVLRQTQPKKKSSAAAIVICAVIGAVVIAGIVTSILSAVLSNISLFDVAELMAENEPVDSAYTEDMIEYENSSLLQTGESFEFPDGTLRLKSAEKTARGSGKKTSRFTFTVEVVNTSASRKSFDLADIALYDKDGTDLYYDLENTDERYMTFLYAERADEDFDLNVVNSLDLDSGESAEIVFYFSGSSKTDELYPSVFLYSTEGRDEYSVTADYKVIFSELEGATPSQR